VPPGIGREGSTGVRQNGWVRALRSERLAAALLVIAAAAGLILANSPLAPTLFAARDLHLDIPLLGLELSIGHWITDGLLAVFFFLAAIELRHELTHGELDSPRKALIPAIAAIGGVVVPALLFLLIVRDPELARGWPIPTATDIAFALGVLAIVGRGLPGRVRALLLALAVIDDLIAILFIALFFTTGLNPLPLLIAVPVVLVFGWLGYRARRSAPIMIAMVVLGLAAWVLVHLSGVHSTIAGVALGLILAPAVAPRVQHALEPVSNVAILPLFAFTAALVAIPNVGASGLSPVFWGIAIALPLGKLVGITGGALLASRLMPAAERRAALPIGDVLVVAGLGGIGFTVSLLMNQLAYRGQDEIVAEGTLAVLAGSVAAAVIGGVLTAVRARAARRAGA
jgi:NhaA family Na+:H+ antiporter